MKISQDESEFDSRQLRLTRALVEDITRTLFDELDVERETLVAAGRSIAFSVASLLDGSRVLPDQSKPLIPHLTFADSDERSALVTSAGGSWMHEYVHGLVSEVFSEYDPPTILNSELKRIPVRGLAVLAQRGIARGLQILNMAHGKELPKKHAKMVDQLLNLLSDVAQFDGDTDRHTEILPWALRKDFETPLESLAADSPQRCLFLAAQEATRLNYRKVSGALSFAAMVGDGKGAKWSRLHRSAETANYLDFRFIQSLLRPSKQPNEHLFRTDQLGALWPNGEPKWERYQAKK